MKLNPEDLTVSSFEATASAAASANALQPIIITPNDPTAATWCYICPAETERCW
jgi:hypothetical protein